MKMNLEELKDWQDGARRQLDREIERLQEREEQLMDNILKAVRTYLNTSKRKTQAKREAAKMVITELFSSAKVELPDDILDMLDHLDDEQTEPKVVSVSGNYNEIHDNTSVTL